MNKHATAPQSRRLKRSPAALRTDQRHDSAHKHVTGTADLYRRHAGAGRACCMAASGCRRRRTRTIMSHRPVGGARRARRRRCAHRRGRARRERHVSPPAATTSRCFADGEVEFFGQPLFAVVAETRDAGAPRRQAGEGRVSRNCRRSTSTTRAPKQARSSRRATDARSAAMPPTRDRQRAAPAEGPDARSAARSISISKARSRWPSRARTATSPSIPRPSIRARSSTWSAQVLGVPNNAVTVEVRRMGGGFGGKETQGDAVRRRSPRSRAKTHRRAVQAPPRPRRRHDR